MTNVLVFTNNYEDLDDVITTGDGMKREQRESIFHVQKKQM